MKLLCRTGKRNNLKFYFKYNVCQGFELRCHDIVDEKLESLMDDELFNYIKSTYGILTREQVEGYSVFEKLKLPCIGYDHSNWREMLGGDMGTRVELGNQHEFPRILLFGSRTIRNVYLFHSLIDTFLDNMTDDSKSKVSFIGGGAKGADTEGIGHIKDKYLYEEFLANWSDLTGCTNPKKNAYGYYNPRAGHLRNEEMGQTCNCALGFWDGKSSGSASMMKILKQWNKPYMVMGFDGEILEEFRCDDFDKWLK